MSVIKIDNTPIETRRSNRAKRISLAVHPGGRAVLTIPPRASQQLVEGFLYQHKNWLKQQIIKASKIDDGIPLPAGRKDYLRNKEKARRFILTCLEKHNQNYRLRFCRVSVKNLYASWGSCSSKKNLNFNYKLIHLPTHLAEYIVVHELCHLKEMNHSARFWDLVSKAVPNHKRFRKELREYQM